VSSLSPACVQQVQFHIPDLTDANQLNAVVPGNFSLVCVLFQDVPGNVSFVSFFQGMFFLFMFCFRLRSWLSVHADHYLWSRLFSPFRLPNEFSSSKRAFPLPGLLRANATHHPGAKKRRITVMLEVLQGGLYGGTSKLQILQAVFEVFASQWAHYIFVHSLCPGQCRRHKPVFCDV
jgi:hypothetical protein